MKALMWFTFDLRLQDLPALRAATNSANEIIPIFILDDEDPWAHQGASRWWLHHSIDRLDSDIKANQGRLILKRGNCLEIIPKLCEEQGISSVFFSRAYEPWLADKQMQLARLLQPQITCKRYAGRLLIEPDEILTQKGTPFKVFTPYYKYCRDRISPQFPSEPLSIPWAKKSKITSEKLNQWRLLPSKPNWAKNFSQYWHPGEENAHAQLGNASKERLHQYQQSRDLPWLDGTSRLSPHLHFGEISPHRIISQLDQCTTMDQEQKEAYLRQILWRDFSHYLLHHFPHTTHSPFQKSFSSFPWKENPPLLKKWQQGQTGYPIVDAGMRELWQTGWMHNRVRMITASFLCKHLLQPWQHGAQWFWQTLVDADLANNTMGWQWVAGCGADAAPYFRIFNPILQGEKFDPNGDYVRKWIPELGLLENKYLHKPWQAPQETLAQANIRLDADYPLPMVDHKSAREDALLAYKIMKH